MSESPDETEEICALLRHLAEGIQRQAEIVLHDSHPEWMRDQYEIARPGYANAARQLFEAERRVRACRDEHQ